MEREEYFDTSKIKGKMQLVIASETAAALIKFCDQELEFEQAVVQSGKSFQDCLDSVVKGVKRGLSDLEAYNRAVKFYFSTAAVHFNMTIDLSGDVSIPDPPITMTKSSLSISLDSLLDF